MAQKFLSGLMLILFVSACGAQGQAQAGGGAHVWVDAPLNGAIVPPNANINIVAYASARGSDTTQMLLLVNGAPTGTMVISRVKEGLAKGEGVWMPPAPGHYSLSVQAITADGTAAVSEPVLLIVEKGAVTDMGAVTVTPPVLLTLTADSTSLSAGSCTFLRWQVMIPNPQSIDLNGQHAPPQGEMQVCPCFTTQYDLIVFAGDKYAQSVTIQVNGSCITPTTPPAPVNNVLNFWADSTTIPAGSCTFLRWDSVNAVKVYLDGQEVSVSGQKRVCPCNTKNHSLAAGFMDGSKQERSLTINVSGSCQAPPVTVPPPPTEPPPQDTTPPPIPAPLNPGNGSESNPPTQYCPVTLRWYPVSDPSGVTYQVRLDKRAGGNWSTIGTWNTTAAEYAVPNNALFCDYTDYRWRVRAVDGAGNASNWSVWFYFAMPIP